MAGRSPTCSSRSPADGDDDSDGDHDDDGDGSVPDGRAARRALAGRRTVEDVTDPLLHLVASSGFDPDDPGPYAPASLADEGFVRCSRVEQVAGTARLLFAGTADLLLLVIDPRLLGDAEVREEDLYGLGMTFPLVAGPIPREAVVEVRPYPPGRGGRWSRPELAPLS